MRSAFNSMPTRAEHQAASPGCLWCAADDRDKRVQRVKQFAANQNPPSRFTYKGTH